MGPVLGGWRTVAGIAVASAGVAAFAPGAAGATIDVRAGDFSERDLAAFNAFYPTRTVVHEGDRVRFSVLGFHTIVVPKRGAGAPPLLAPTGKKNAPRNDPAGAPYWWGGTPELSFNPAAAAPSGGTSASAKSTVNSGFLFRGNPPKFTITFPKAGSYQVLCAIHPKMKGTVVVLPKAVRGPKPRVLAARAKAEKAADLARVRATLKKARALPSGPNVQIGPGNARGEVFAFFPEKNAVAAGTTVNFRMTGPNEVHTVTFGPESFVDKVEKAFQDKLDPEGVQSSDPPNTALSISPTTHGNGFLNSGVLFGSGFPRGPRGFSVTFATPGVYDYRCIVHSDMKGSVTVS